jgi:hypothetical protein
MSSIYSLPSIYLGSSKEGRDVYEHVYDTLKATDKRFPSANSFLRHLIVYALEHDKTLQPHR